MLKISGLDSMIRSLEEAQKAIAEANGELGSVSYDPHDPISIEVAIQRANAMVDERLGAYANNPLIAPLIEASKESFREGIIERAAAARLKGNDENEQQD